MNNILEVLIIFNTIAVIALLYRYYRLKLIMYSFRQISFNMLEDITALYTFITININRLETVETEIKIEDAPSKDVYNNIREEIRKCFNGMIDHYLKPENRNYIK